MFQKNILPYLPFGIIFLAWFAGMFIDIMEIDAGQYASMAQEMIKNGDYLHLVDRGEAYLDKPPLIFWLTVFSFKIFGISTFSYKLPSVLMSILAVFSVQRLGHFLYNRRTGYLAALILASCQAVFLMNNDVKTDMYMIGPMVFALWQLVVFARGGKWWHLQLGFAGLAVAMLAKGPIGVVAPLLGMGADFLIRRDWKGLFRRPWLLGLPIFALILLPFSIGLYQQFGWVGVEFFFWTQSFGRVTGASEWQNDASAFFFVHTYLWSFLPWSFVMIGGMARRGWRIIRDGFYLPSTAEAISISGFVLLFIAMSTSRFKLPHYIFVAFPFAAILSANFIDELLEEPLLEKWRRFFSGLHIVEAVLALILPFALMAWAFPEISLLLTIVYLVVSLGIFSIFLFSNSKEFRLFLLVSLAFSWGNFYMNAGLYPTILSYQSSSQAGHYIQENKIPSSQVYGFLVGGRALDFYGGDVAVQLEKTEEIGTKFSLPMYIYTQDAGLEAIRAAGFAPKILKTMPQFRVANLKPKFINPATRAEKLTNRYLLEIR